MFPTEAQAAAHKDKQDDKYSTEIAVIMCEVNMVILFLCGGIGGRGQGILTMPLWYIVVDIALYYGVPRDNVYRKRLFVMTLFMQAMILGLMLPFYGLAWICVFENQCI